MPHNNDESTEEPKKKKLKFLQDYKGLILSGAKTSTIRKGHKSKYQEGDVVDIVAGDEVIGEAVIKAVRHTTFKELTPKDARKDGFSSKSKLKKALKEIYGEFKSDDPITQIEFEMVKRKR